MMRVDCDSVYKSSSANSVTGLPVGFLVAYGDFKLAFEMNPEELADLIKNLKKKNDVHSVLADRKLLMYTVSQAQHML